MADNSEGNSTEDPYAILGLSRGASIEQIKEAYRRLAKRFHPDAGGTPSQFRKIDEAYEKLLVTHDASTDLVVLSRTDLEHFADRAHIRLLLAEELVRKDYLEREALRGRENRRFLIRGGVAIPMLILVLSIVQQLIQMNPATMIGLMSVIVALVLIVLESIRERALVLTESSRTASTFSEMQGKLHELERLSLDRTLFDVFRRRSEGKERCSFDLAIARLSNLIPMATGRRVSSSQAAYVLLQWEQMGWLRRMDRNGMEYLVFETKS